jgi:anti-anti-sigma regulatory factor
MATEKVILDCAHVDAADLGAVDCIARRMLDARRDGCECCLRHASNELLELIAFAGLDGVLRVEVQRQPEQREQLRRVEEEGELPDPPT